MCFLRYEGRLCLYATIYTNRPAKNMLNPPATKSNANNAMIALPVVSGLALVSTPPVAACPRTVSAPGEYTASDAGSSICGAPEDAEVCEAVIVGGGDAVWPGVVLGVGARVAVCVRVGGDVDEVVAVRVAAFACAVVFSSSA